MCYGVAPDGASVHVVSVYHPAYGLLGMIKELIITLGLIFQFVNTKESICFHMMFHIDLKYKISKLVGENIL